MVGREAPCLSLFPRSRRTHARFRVPRSRSIAARSFRRSHVALRFRRAARDDVKTLSSWLIRSRAENCCSELMGLRMYPVRALTGLDLRTFSCKTDEKIITRPTFLTASLGDAFHQGDRESNVWGL